MANAHPEIVISIVEQINYHLFSSKIGVAEAEVVAMKSWPDWPLSKSSIAGLARYVDHERAQDYVPADLVGESVGGRRGHASRAQRLYESLESRRIPYATEPWNVTVHDDGLAYQRIRGPESTVRGPATCLDLSLLFAGMCLAADLRPMVALKEEYGPHALVIVDLEQSLHDSPAASAISSTFTQRPDEAGVWDGGPLDAVGMAGTGWLVVDVVCASVGRFSLSFSSMGTELTNGRYLDAPWSCIDVAAIQKAPGFVAYEEPVGRTRPPIRSYLPTYPSFRNYPTRKPRIAELSDRIRVNATDGPTKIVIRAPQGYGKSLLALRLASAADHNSGWFLAANDQTTLISSLARAERAEHPTVGDGMISDDEKPDVGEDRSLAAFALARLRDSLAPWVVVIDNCDQDPHDPRKGVWNILPFPRVAGQTLIVTTTHDAWQSIGRTEDWLDLDLTPLDREDLELLRLSEEFDASVDGRPLVAESLAKLTESDPETTTTAGTDGPALMWSLYLDGSHSRESVDIARVLAWCPPEGIPLAMIPGGLDTRGLCQELIDAQLVSPLGTNQNRQVVMHRLVAAAIRDQSRGDGLIAAEAIKRVILDAKGVALLTHANDDAALLRLEDEDQVLASEWSGLFWHGLGHIRERRGPVARSAEHFRRALQTLNKGDTEEYAESLIGVARDTYQRSSDPVMLRDAAEQAKEAYALLEGLAKQSARQMREQANALALLIHQKLAGFERNRSKRLELLLSIHSGLWASYEARRVIARPEETFVSGSDPIQIDGLGSERAFFNLAGVNVQIAKTAHSLSSTDPRVESALAEAAHVYETVRSLRQSRYQGRPHGHLASCIHGLAIVDYYRSLLKYPSADLISVLQTAGTALTQRIEVVVGLYGSSDDALHDTDVGKSVTFMMKVAALADVRRVDSGDSSGRAYVLRTMVEAFEEYEGHLG